MIPVIWSKSFPVKIISDIIKKGYYPSTYKTKYMVRYKSFSLPSHYRHYYRHITAKSLSIVLESLRHSFFDKIPQ